MVQKRPFDTAEIFEVSFKHPKHVETNNQLVSFSESVFPDDVSRTHIPKNSGGSLVEDPLKLENKLCNSKIKLCLSRGFKFMIN